MLTREMFDRYNTVDAADKKQGVEKLSLFLENQSGGAMK